MVRRKGANNQTAVKPASRLNCHPEMYISWGNNIFVRKLTFVQFTRLIEQPTAGAHDRCVRPSSVGKPQCLSICTGPTENSGAASRKRNRRLSDLRFQG